MEVIKRNGNNIFSGRPVKHEAYQTIWICKTNIDSEHDIATVSAKFVGHAGIVKWTIDLYDDDKVLRVIARHLELQELIALVNEAGYSCEELPD